MDFFYKDGLTIALGDGLMARRRTLTPLIGVRIPVPQPVDIKKPSSLLSVEGFFVFEELQK